MVEVAEEIGVENIEAAILQIYAFVVMTFLILGTVTLRQ